MPRAKANALFWPQLPAGLYNLSAGPICLVQVACAGVPKAVSVGTVTLASGAKPQKQYTNTCNKHAGMHTRTTRDKSLLLQGQPFRRSDAQMDCHKGISCQSPLPITTNHSQRPVTCL